MGVEIFILAILIILNAFFAGSEMALVSLSDSRLKQLAEDGDKKAKSVQRLLSEPSRFLATIQIGITLSTLMASAFATRNFVGMMSISLNKYFEPAIDRQLLEVVATIIITLVLSYFTLVLGELVPKRLAVHKAEQIAFLATAPLAILSKVISPFVQLLTFSTNLIVRVFGVDPNVEEEEVTEEEIRMMVDVGQERGTIQAAEKEMINNIFEFDNKTVSDIMTHRTNIVAIPLDLSFQEAVHVANVEKYTRIPVYEENIDHIVGILHVKDLFTFIENGSQKQFNLQELIREPFYALESLRIDHLFRDMQKNKVHMAIAIDEYGGTDGIVTMEDILEEIVGNIFDEYDDPELDREEIEKIAEQEYMMIGTVDLDDVEDMLKVDFPTEEFDTLSGFIIGQLGYIPDREERPTIEYENHLFVVEEINERRIVKVKVIVLEGEEQE